MSIKLKIGDKVKIPKTKSTGAPLGHSNMVTAAKSMGQDFLYFKNKDGYVYSLGVSMDGIAGDHFTIDDIELYEEYKTKINSAVTEFLINDAKEQEEDLRKYDVIKYGELGLEVEGVNFGEVTEETLKTKLRTLSTNYMIANIEMHKLLYSDPYQYADELKRIKNFNSPGQPLLHGSPELNARYNEIFNEEYTEGEIGWYDWNKEYLSSITIEDVLSTNELPNYEDPYEEGDGGGYISLPALRVYKERAGEWTADNEVQYQYRVIL